MNKFLILIASFFIISYLSYGYAQHNENDIVQTPYKVSEIKEADMIIYNGIGFDAWLGDDDQFYDSFLVDVSKGLQLIKINQEELEKVRHDNHNGHECRYDPHIWLDPVLVKNISKTISNAFVKFDPH